MRAVALTLLLCFLAELLAFGQTTHSNSFSWTWTQTSGDPATGVHVYRSQVAGTQGTLLATLPAGTLTYTDSTVSAGQTNYYQIAEFNAKGDSTLSNQITCVTPFQVPGPAPTLVPGIAK